MKPFELLAEAVVKGAPAKAVMEVGAKELSQPGSIKKAVEKEVAEATEFKKGQLVKWNFDTSTPDLGIVLSVKPGGPVTVQRGSGAPSKVFKKPDDPDFGIRPASKSDLAKSIKNLQKAKSKMKPGRARNQVASELADKLDWKRKGLGEQKLGTGARFTKLKKKLAKKGKVRDPAAVAAYIGRKKHGAKKMAKMAGKGRRQAAGK